MTCEVRRYLQLESSARVFVARAFISLAVMDLRLRLVSLERLARRSSRSVDEAEISVHALRHARRYAHWIEIASRHHIVRAQCLHRSLVLHRWLQREGLPSKVMIGVRKDNSSLKAHAWVELGGHVVNDTSDSVTSFTPLAPSRLQSIAASQIEGGLDTADPCSGWEE